MHLYTTKKLMLVGALAFGLLAIGRAPGAVAADARPGNSSGAAAQERRDDQHRGDDQDRQYQGFRRSRAYHRAYDRGYRTGLDRGRDDGRGHRSEDPNNSEHYRDADSGYHSKDGPIEAYRLGYREGFQRGYAQNYRRYYRNDRR
jgi:hypothetical protein